MKNLLTAIKTKLATSTLASDVGGRIYLDQAPQGCEFPYVVYFIVSGVPDDCFARDGESVLIQFSLFSASSGATEIGTMYADLRALLDDCTFTITSNRLIWFRRVNLTTMVEEITVANAAQAVRHWAVDYEITIQES